MLPIDPEGPRRHDQLQEEYLDSTRTVGYGLKYQLLNRSFGYFSGFMKHTISDRRIA